MITEFKLMLPFILPSGNELQRMYNADIIMVQKGKRRIPVKRKGRYEEHLKVWRERVWEYLHRQGLINWRAQSKVRINFHLARPGPKPLDESNAINAIDKLIVDNLVKHQIIIDDAPKYLTYGKYTYQTMYPKLSGIVKIHLEELN